MSRNQEWNYISERVIIALNDFFLLYFLIIKSCLWKKNKTEVAFRFLFLRKPKDNGGILVPLQSKGILISFLL